MELDLFGGFFGKKIVFSKFIKFVKIVLELKKINIDNELFVSEDFIRVKIFFLFFVKSMLFLVGIVNIVKLL